MDDLRFINELETYVAQSAVVLVLLGSPKYFSSSNCKREAATAMSEAKPLVLLHDADQKKNGTPRLCELNAACCAEHREFIFGADTASRPVIPWLRAKDFQRVSLQLVAQELVRASLAYEAVDVTSLLPLQLPGDIRSRAIEFKQPVRLYVSKANEGAAMVARTLQAELDTPMLSLHDPSLALPGEQPTHWLLYLRKDTFSGPTASDLTEELMGALEMETRIPIVMLHETSEQAHGSPTFDAIFASTPAQLIGKGLYDSLAVPWRAEFELREVSVRIVAMELGALPVTRRQQLRLRCLTRAVWVEMTRVGLAVRAAYERWSRSRRRAVESMEGELGLDLVKGSNSARLAV